MPPLHFIRPAIPQLRTSPPLGPEWQHEIKFDGWRLQIQKTGQGVKIYSKNAINLTARVRAIAAAVEALPVTTCILDAELVAIGMDGRQEFDAIGKRGALHQAWIFDILERDGEILISLPLSQRRRHLSVLMKGAVDALRLSETFDDPIKLLGAADDLGLEGIVSKRLESPYRSGTRSGWIKVKTAAWSAANAERWRKFQKR